MTVITDASAPPAEAHRGRRVQRMIAGRSEHDDLVGLCRMAATGPDWTRLALTEVIVQHAAGSGIAYSREQQLLNTPVPKG